MLVKLPIDAEHLAELVRPLPRHGERRDRAGTGAADAVPFGILRDVVVLVQDRHQFVHDHPRVLVVERVVFGRPVRVAIAPVLRRRLGLIRASSGVDEHGNHHRDLAAIDQVVEHVGRPQIAVHVLERLPVVEDHQARRGLRVVLRRHVDPVGVLRAGIGLARQRERPADLSLRHAVARVGVGAELIVDVGIGSRRRLRRCRLHDAEQSGEKSRRVQRHQYTPVLLTNASIRLSGDHDGTLMVPWPP